MKVHRGLQTIRLLDESDDYVEAPSASLDNSGSCTQNSAKPQSKQTQISGNTNTVGLVRPS